MRQNALARLGCETKPFSLAAFEEYVSADAAKALYAKALAAVARAPAIKPDTLMMQISVQPEFFNALQFVISGPHPVPENGSSERFGCLVLHYPECDMPARSHVSSSGQWSKPPSTMPVVNWRLED